MLLAGHQSGRWLLSSPKRKLQLEEVVGQKYTLPSVPYGHQGWVAEYLCLPYKILNCPWFLPNKKPYRKDTSWQYLKAHPTPESPGHCMDIKDSPLRACICCWINCSGEPLCNYSILTPKQNCCVCVDGRSTQLIGTSQTTQPSVSGPSKVKVVCCLSRLQQAQVWNFLCHQSIFGFHYRSLNMANIQEGVIFTYRTSSSLDFL